MARTTAHRYLKDRTWLRQVWVDDRGMFAQVSLTEQRYLHDFYAPAKDLSETEALEHRRPVTLLHPSLPQRAGRALKALKREVAAVERYRRESLRLAKKLDRQLQVAGPKLKRRRVKVEHIVACPVLRPKPDLERYARALVALAKPREATDDSSSAPTTSGARHRTLVVPAERHRQNAS